MSVQTKFRMFSPVLFFTVFSIGVLRAAEMSAEGTAYKLLVSTPTKLWIEGDSTFHRYDAQASKIDLEAAGSIGLPAPSDAALPARNPAASSKYFPWDTTLKSVIAAPNLSKFVLKIPVSGLKSGIPGLAGKIHGTLKHKKFPEIIFTMSSYEAVPAASAGKPADGGKDAYIIRAAGALDIAGTRRDTTLEFEAFPSGGFIRLKGQKDILMTDFDVRPPAVLFIKAADKVEVKWDILLEVAR